MLPAKLWDIKKKKKDLPLIVALVSIQQDRI